jgi:hypothetical protein
MIARFCLSCTRSVEVLHARGATANCEEPTGEDGMLNGRIVPLECKRPAVGCQHDDGIFAQWLCAEHAAAFLGRGE